MDLLGSACHSSSGLASSGRRKKINFSVSNKRLGSYYHPEASLTQTGLTAGKEKAAEWADSLCIMYSKPTQKIQTKPQQFAGFQRHPACQEEGVHLSYRQAQCALGIGITGNKTYWTKSNGVTEQWLPCPCTPCEDKQSLFLPLLTSTPVSLGYLFHQKKHNLCHEDKWATTGGVFLL